MSDRVYRDFIDDILENCNDILHFIENYDFEMFSKDKKTQKAVVRSLEIIGEAANKIPDEIKNQYSEIPWREIINMRNKLIHEYFGIDNSILWETIKSDIPFLLAKIKNITDIF